MSISAMEESTNAIDFTLETTLHGLFSMIDNSRAIIFETRGLTKLSHVVRVSQHRANAVKWIKDVRFHTIIFVKLI